MQRMSLIVWNEVPMQHRYCFEAVSRTLNNICNHEDNSDMFEGIPILLGRDFVQIAPVVPRANQSTTVHISLQSSPLWNQFQILSLTVNIHIQIGFNNIAFAEWLSQISYNLIMYDKLHLLHYIRAYTELTDLIHFVYPLVVLANTSNNFILYTNHCILVFHNDIVNQFNTRILQQVLNIMQVFHAIDICHITEEDLNFAELPAKYLQSLDCSGLPLSCLELKVGCLIMLLRN